MEEKRFASLADIIPVEGIPNHFRSTLTYNDDVMLCHFSVKKGVTVELHNHEAAQIGYILSGKINFFNEKGVMFTGKSGDSYAFKSKELHGCTALEDCTFIECFTPARNEYK